MKSYVAIAVIVSAGMVASSFVVSKLYLRVRKEESIAVKGVSERIVRAGIGKLTFEVVETDPVLSNAVIRARSHYKTLLDEIGEKVGTGVELAKAEPTIRRVMATADDGRETDRLAYYHVSNPCTVTTTNVLLVAEVAAVLADCASRNILVQSQPPQYFLDGLDSIKLEMLKEATLDGWQRAHALAQKNGGVGRLVSANQGVFQITAPHSVDSSWQGEYDTTTIDKRIQAVVSLQYAVR